MCRDGVRNGITYYRKYCKECRSAAYRAKRFGSDIPWKDRLIKVKSRADKRKITIDIDVEYLEHIWALQNGLCVYTKDRMLRSYGLRNHPQVVSIDRIDPAAGYVKGNIVLCTARANSIKQDMTLEEFQEWMPLWYSRLQEFETRRDNAGNTADDQS